MLSRSRGKPTEMTHTPTSAAATRPAIASATTDLDARAGRGFTAARAARAWIRSRRSGGGWPPTTSSSRHCSAWLRGSSIAAPPLFDARAQAGVRPLQEALHPFFSQTKRRADGAPVTLLRKAEVECAAGLRRQDLETSTQGVERRAAVVVVAEPDEGLLRDGEIQVAGRRTALQPQIAGDASQIGAGAIGPEPGQRLVEHRDEGVLGQLVRLHRPRAEEAQVAPDVRLMARDQAVEAQVVGGRDGQRDCHVRPSRLWVLRR